MDNRYEDFFGLSRPKFEYLDHKMTDEDKARLGKEYSKILTEVTLLRAIPGTISTSIAVLWGLSFVPPVREAHGPFGKQFCRDILWRNPSLKLGLFVALPLIMIMGSYKKFSDRMRPVYIDVFEKVGHYKLELP